MNNKKMSLTALVVAVFLASCANSGQPNSNSSSKVQIANPASVYCGEVGGRTFTKTLPDGTEYGVCLFEDNRQCGEWALFRNECLVGGVKVIGYYTDAARFCAITGGDYHITAYATAEQPEQGTCTIPGGKMCNVRAYFLGQCR